MADEAATDEHREGAAANETPNEQPNDDAGAGGKTQILADLATERDKRQSLEQQFTSLKDGLAQALGLGQQAEVTPEQLAEQLTTAQSEATQARTELAVFRSVPDGVDAQALLDSRAFSQVIAKIDAADPGAITGAVTQFVEANPRFKTATTLRSPGSKDAGAGGANASGFTTMDDLLRGRQ